MSEHDKREGHGGHHDAHAGHAGKESHGAFGSKTGEHGSHPPGHAGSSSHGQRSHAESGHADSPGHGGHGGHHKKPWNLLAAIAILLLFIAVLAIRESEGAKKTVPVPDVTPGPDDAIPTDVSHILSSPEAYHGKVVSLSGVFGFKGGDTRAKNYELFDERRQSIRMNITGFDYPRVVPYEVLARVDASKPTDPFLNVLKVEPVYETPVEH